MRHAIHLFSWVLTILCLLAISKTFSQTNFWQQMNNGLTNLNVSAVAADSGGALYVAAGSDSVFRSTNNGSSWTPTGQTNVASLGVLETNSLGYIFAGDGFDGVYRSTDNGNSWFQVNNGLSNTFIRALAIKPSGEIFAGTMRVAVGTILYGIYRTTNNGDSWLPVNTGLRDSTGIGSFGISPGGDIFAGSSDGGGIYRSTNNGESWTQMNNGLPTGLNVTAIAVSPNGYVFAGTIYSPSGTQDTVIYRSTDNGNTWTHVYIGPPILSIVWSLAINVQRHIFAAIAQSTAGYGILRSTDDGLNWTLINSGLTTNATVYDLVFNPSGLLFAGTGGGGVFRSVESTTFVEQVGREIPPSFSLHQNYPNPFNPVTTIAYELSTICHVNLKVYDVLGREVGTLVDESKHPGAYTVKWHAAGVTGGIYFYRLHAGSFLETRKLVLLK